MQTTQIHYAEVKQIWNSASIAKRQRLLVAAGHPNNICQARAFDFVPSAIRDDVIAAYNRSVIKNKFDKPVKQIASRKA